MLPLGVRSGINSISVMGSTMDSSAEWEIKMSYPALAGYIRRCEAPLTSSTEPLAIAACGEAR
jgi:hypothetical protein